jgi:hypothetical protein
VIARSRANGQARKEVNIDYTDIKQVGLTTNDEEANKLQEGWEMLQIVERGCQYYFLLVNRIAE